jgi:NifB/MoaA-like Fe-S oxidoreductase
MLRAEGDLFLCGTSVEDLSKELKTKIEIANTDGAAFVEAILGLKEV